MNNPDILQRKIISTLPMDYFSSEERNNLIADLIELAKSDGTVSIPEMTYLVWIAQKLGISQGELSHIANGNRPSYRSFSAGQRLEHFHKMLNMVFVDGMASTDELENCRAIAYQIGLDRAKVDHLINEIKAQPQTMVNFETLKATFEG